MLEVLWQIQAACIDDVSLDHVDSWNQQHHHQRLNGKKEILVICYTTTEKQPLHFIWVYRLFSEH